MKVQEFDFSVDLLRAVLWQYNDATRLQSLMRQKSEWYAEAHSLFWTDWLRDVFDLTTANEFGLAVWGVILNIPLAINLPDDGPRPAWGFGQFNKNYDQGTFGRDESGIARLTLEQKRIVLRLRFFQLVTDATVPHINFILREVFGAGYVLDARDMTAVYYFPRAFAPGLQTVIEDLDLLPRPAGVKISIVVDPTRVFGFAPFYQNFDNGGFGA